MVIKVLYFSTTLMSSIADGMQASECFYKNITTSNLLTWRLFAMVDVIIN